MNKLEALTLLLLAGLTACSSSSSGPGAIDPNDRAAVSASLAAKINGQAAIRVNGDLPSATVTTDVLKVEGGEDKVASNGETLDLDVLVTATTDVSSLLLKVVGQSLDYLSIDLSGAAKLSGGPVQIDLEIPENILDGEFCVVYVVQTETDTSEPSQQQCITVESTLDDPAESAQPTPSDAPTASPAPTGTPAPSSAPTAVPSSSPVPTSEPTAAPSNTPTPTASPSPEPTSTPAPTSEPGGGSAAACFNGDLFITGTRIVQTYKSTTSDGTVDFTDDRTVTGPATFNGQSATETTGTTTSTATGSGTSTTTTATYSRQNAQVPSIEALGSTSSSSTEFGSVENENVISPPRVDRFDLSPGESQSQMYTVSSTTTSFGQTISSETQNDVTRTYVGRATVTVPAGTYETCQFQETGTATTTVNGQTSSSSVDTTNYFDVASGLLVKSVSSGTTTELVEATINGSAVR